MTSIQTLAAEHDMQPHELIAFMDWHDTYTYDQDEISEADETTAREALAVAQELAE